MSIFERKGINLFSFIIISFMKIMLDITTKTVIGIPKILYLNESIILNDNKALIDLVRPQPGQAIFKILLNIQCHFKSKTNNNKNIIK